MLNSLRRFGAICLAALGWSNVTYAQVVATCHGPSTARQQVVYLHGLDTPKPSAQELENRTLLKAMAEDLGLRLAIARSEFKCQSKLCWPHQTDKDLHRTFDALRKAAGPCFKPGKSSFGLIGFSNGGYFASKLIQHCLKPKVDWVVAAGSAGSWHQGKIQNPQTCGQLALMIGQQDISHDKAQRYYDQLKTAGFNLSFATFKGKHELHGATLRRILGELLK